MTPPVYATLEQYRAQPGGGSYTDDAITAMLPQASLRLDEILIGAIYETDEDDMPVDAGVAEIFMRATCAQAKFMLVQDDETGAKHGYQNVSVGSVSYSRAQGATGVDAERFAPAAISILRVEGVLPINALTYN